jgi:hypothetical protein
VYMFLERKLVSTFAFTSEVLPSQSKTRQLLGAVQYADDLKPNCRSCASKMQYLIPESKQPNQVGSIRSYTDEVARVYIGMMPGG